ncbi:GNAT family N-acetyltransferase [bacterium]|nr:GNAT family N-acetyltransferase [bacterium]
MTAPPPVYRLREATVADAAVVAHHRVAMFRDMNALGAADGAMLETASRRHLAAALADGSYRGWVLEDADGVVAGGGLMLRSLLPRPGYLEGGMEGYVLNVYTEPTHRRRGLARRLMAAILAWCDAARVSRVSLHASDDGRALYAALGFAPTNEMRRDTAPDAA